MTMLYRSPRRLMLICALGLLVVVSRPPALAQDAAAPAADGAAAAEAAPQPPDAPDALEATGQTVKVDGSASDDQIAERLREILESSARYDELVVRVDQGIVFMDGRTEQDAYKDWASQLARRTEDVVAVVNNLLVEPPPVLEQYAVKDELRGLWNSFVRALPLAGIGLATLIASILLALFIVRLLGAPLRWLTDSHLLRNVIRKVVALVVVVAGVVVFLQISGLTNLALTVVSGTGLLGLIVGFAFRDIAENFLASILLSVQTPFRLGDVIGVVGHTGVVQKVTLRGTTLVDFDGNHIQIANATVYKSTLKNLTANPKRRIHFDVGIGYDASVKKAQEVAAITLREHEAVLDDPEAMVLVDRLGAATINLKVYFWIDAHEHSAIKLKSVMIRRVLRRLEHAGVGMPDEAREVIFPQGVPIQSSDTGGGGAATETAGKVSEQDRKPCRDAAVIDADLTEHHSDAEGDLASEVDEIKRQAAAARDPEAGAGIVD